MTRKEGSESYVIPEVGSSHLPHSEGSVPYFNAVSSDYFNRYKERSPGGYAFRVRKQRVLELLDGRGGRILDVGCGPGVITEELLELGYEYWGLDAAPNMIQECRRTFGGKPRAHFCPGDAISLDFPSGSFGTVLCIGVIDHIAAYPLAIKEMLRVLRKDGVLLVAFPNLHSPWAWWRNYVFYPTARFLRPFYCKLLGHAVKPSLRTIARLQPAKRMRRLIEKSDGEVTDIVYYNFNQFISPLDEIFPCWATWLAGKLEPLRSTRFKWLGSGFIVKARKSA